MTPPRECPGCHAGELLVSAEVPAGACHEIANLDWDNVVVLADGPICGIAEEGALAFTEISMLTGRYFHLLDYRHGLSWSVENGL